MSAFLGFTIAGIVFGAVYPVVPSRLGGVNVTYHELITIGVAVAVAVGLRLLFYRPRIGVAMRAVVDDRDLAALNGARPIRIGQLSWMLGSMLAALGGILLAPKVGLD